MTVKVHIFKIGHFPRPKIESESSFFQSTLSIHDKKLVGRVVSYIKEKKEKNRKNGIFIVFSKRDFSGPPFKNGARGLKFSGSCYF